MNIRKYPLVSDQVSYEEVETIVRELEAILSRNIAGDVMELGCYEGTTSLFLQRVLVQQPTRKQLYLYDSFEGLPPKTSQDASPAGEQFKTGELHASKAKLITHFKHAGLPVPIIHKGWFDTIPESVLPKTIAFAFLDGDYYDSIKTSLRLIEDRLTPGATIIIDDYQSEALPGARRATDEWLHKKGYACQSERSLAIIHCR